MYFPSVDLRGPSDPAGDDGAQVTSATLQIHQKNNYGSGTMGYTVRRATKSWSNPTWNNMSAYNTTADQVSASSCGGHGVDTAT